MKFEINSDINGLNFWKEAYKNHPQKGPDILSISAPEENIQFKTTFYFGTKVGQLCCKIAGEESIFDGIDISPKDWSQLYEYLNKRNTNGKIKKSPTEKYIEKTLKEQKAVSDKKRLEYEKTGNPEIVISYIKNSKSGAVLQEAWINKAIQGFIRTDQTDILKKAFLPHRGENKESRKRDIKNMIFAERIDKRRRAGQSLKESLLNEIGNMNNGSMLEDKLISLKNQYSRAKKIKTEVTIQETAKFFTISAFPAKIIKDNLTVFGEWTINFPKR